MALVAGCDSSVQKAADDPDVVPVLLEHVLGLRVEAGRRCVVLSVQRHETQDGESPTLHPRRVEVAQQGQSLGTEFLGLLVVTLLGCQNAGRIQRASEGQGGHIPAFCQRLIQPSAPLAEAGSYVPEPAQRRCETHTRFGVPTLHRPRQSGAEVALLRLQPIQPGCLTRPPQHGLCLLGQGQEPVVVALTNGLGLVRLAELRQGVSSEQLVQIEAAV